MVQYCTNCGFELEDDAEFCTQCGLNLKDGSNKPAVVPSANRSIKIRNFIGENDNIIVDPPPPSGCCQGGWLPCFHVPM